MKYIASVLFLWMTLCNLTAQNLDLIVTNANDSIACKISSETAEVIYFAVFKNGKNIESFIKRNDIIQLTYQAVYKKDISRIPNTIFFHTRTSEMVSSKNVLYGTFGYFLIYGQLSINYEYILATNPESFFSGSFIRAGVGKYMDWGGDGPIWVNTFGAFTGRNTNHFEMSLGYTVMVNTLDDETYVGFAGGIGYRYQKPEGGFVFRTGLGFPESLYLSVGVSF